MKNLALFLLRHHPAILYIALEILSFAILFQYNRHHQSVYVSAMAGLTGGVFSVTQNFKDFLILTTANEQLAQENAQIKNTLRSSYKDNRVSYKEIYDSTYIRRWRYTDCKVVYNSTNRQKNILIVDKGSRHGVSAGDGLVTDRGAVGVVQNVSADYSSALSLLNTDMSVSAKLSRSGHFGVLRWDGADPRHCWLENIPNHVAVENGDTVSTSGFSTIFPEGIVLGRVRDIDKEVDANFLTLRVELSQDFGAMTHVYAVRDELGGQIDSLMKSASHD